MPIVYISPQEYQRQLVFNCTWSPWLMPDSEEPYLIARLYNTWVVVSLDYLTSLEEHFKARAKIYAGG
jgi:hypothetical protein